ncbi:MAG: DUF126 domain-containing protein [Fervidicoccaceae archaeon]
MRKKEIKLKVLVEGKAEGEVVVYQSPLSFLGEVDPKEGAILLRGGDRLKIADKIFIFPGLRGSTVGSYVIYALKQYGKAPSAMIVRKADPILITGAVLAEIPLAEGINEKDMEEAKEFRRGIFDGERSVLMFID